MIFRLNAHLFYQIFQPVWGQRVYSTSIPVLFHNNPMNHPMYRGISVYFPMIFLFFSYWNLQTSPIFFRDLPWTPRLQLDTEMQSTDEEFSVKRRWQRGHIPWLVGRPFTSYKWDKYPNSRMVYLLENPILSWMIWVYIATFQETSKWFYIGLSFHKWCYNWLIAGKGPTKAAGSNNDNTQCHKS